MKKLFIFLIVVSAITLTFGCVKKAPPSPPPVVVPTAVSMMTEEQFAVSLVERKDVKALQPGDYVLVLVYKNEVNSQASVAIVVKPKADWTRCDLLPLNKKIPLTIVWKAKGGSQLLVTNYLDLETYKPIDKLRLLEPVPYLVRIGQNEYWVSPGGHLWKTWY